MPFGLSQLEGTEAIGRPAVYEHDAYSHNGVPVRARSLMAAFRVTGDDPTAVLRDWVAQLDDGLALDEGSVDASGGPEDPWIDASLRGEDRNGGPGRDTAGLELWVTGGYPILLVEVDRISDDPPRSPTVEDEAGTPPAPESVVDDTERAEGDVLFTEQGNSIHLPPGTRALMPTIPTFGGTGGSTSVLAADDGVAAVRALIEKATTADDNGDVAGPEVTTTEGAEIVTATFNISAGGWGFDVVSIHAPGDPHATLYVTSYAD